MPVHIPNTSINDTKAAIITAHVIIVIVIAIIIIIIIVVVVIVVSFDTPILFSVNLQPHRTGHTGKPCVLLRLLLA